MWYNWIEVEGEIGYGMRTATSAEVVKDIRPGDNIEVAGPTRTISHEAAILFNKSVVARPLMTPEVCSIHVKNTEYAYRWVNHDSERGRFYKLRRSQGFVNATPEDVDVMGGDASVDDGTIRAGDLILMKIRADLYDAALKFNMQKALSLQRTRGVYMDGASSDVFSDAVPTRQTVNDIPFARGKAEAFIPENPDAIINDSVLSGRVDGARKAVDKLRADAQK